MTDIGPAETPSYGNPNRMHVLANGDIVDCGTCRYGSKCQFAHGEEELRGVLRHPKYKTTRRKAYLSTGKCMYGSRCRFIHTRHPGEEDQRFVNYGSSDLSSTASESDDQETQSEGFSLVNPYGNGLEPIDLSQPFGGFNQPMSLAPLSGLSPPKPEFDSYLSQHSFLDYSFQSSDLEILTCAAAFQVAAVPRLAQQFNALDRRGFFNDAVGSQAFATIRVVIVPLVLSKVKSFPALSTFSQLLCGNTAVSILHSAPIVGAGNFCTAYVTLTTWRLRKYCHEKRIRRHLCFNGLHYYDGSGARSGHLSPWFGSCLHVIVAVPTYQARRLFEHQLYFVMAFSGIIFINVLNAQLLLHVCNAYQKDYSTLLISSSSITKSS
ncbi:unnamed protein product [Peronospora belbahrii]|uniref:C3H1-type domain-containing protein n=1 Tax=Peronospora belbahrii TaxID=622444 RepID=A0AAU9KX40_9STRA|nr:unnamed protein product [Peronospora belbahrii]